MATVLALGLIVVIGMFIVSLPVYAVFARLMPRVVAAFAAPLAVMAGVVAAQVATIRSDPGQVVDMSIQMTLLMVLAGITAGLIAVLLFWVRSTVPRPKKTP
ncbi:hypothetical protein ACQW02_05590 [Humitalea sp. 24SJ18S-53]|uniref:hypothetical protein n=1 Tax=Humitalea sp. 24SJ18S-53 TaxID=3422307 RepID=UPI003D66CF68